MCCAARPLRRARRSDEVRDDARDFERGAARERYASATVADAMYDARLAVCFVIELESHSRTGRPEADARADD